MPSRLAGRLAAILYSGLAGALFLVNAAFPHYSATDRRSYALVGVALVVTGIVLWHLPWQRWPRWALLLLIPLSFTIMIVLNSTVPFDPYHYEIYALPIFGWIGLAFRRGTALAVLPLLIPTYVIPLKVTGQFSRDSAVALIYLAIFCLVQGEGLGWLMARLSQVQIAMRANEARYRALSEHANDIVSVVDGQGRITYVSASVRTVLGLDPDALVGLSFFDFLHPDDHALALERLDRGDTTRIETRSRHADGSWHWLEYTIQDARDDPLIGGYITNGRDVTARKLASDALRASEQRFRALVEEAPVGIMIVDAAGVLEEVNPALCAISGYTAGELVGRPFTTIIPPEQAAVLEQRFAHGERVEEEYTVPAKDGRMLTILSAAIYLTNLAGQPRRAAFIVDITARKREEQELISLRQEQAQAAEAMSEVSAVLGGTLDIADLYPLILQHAGKVLPLDYAQIVVPEDGWLTVVAQQGEPHTPVGTRLLPMSEAPVTWARLLQGRPLLIRDTTEDPDWADIPPRVGPYGLRSLISVPLLVEGDLKALFEIASYTPNFYDDRHIQIATIFGDRITQALRNRRLLEIEQQRAGAAEALAQLRSEFVASVSHELRTPLTAIVGFAELLQAHSTRMTEEHRQEQIDNIVLSANRQQRLVEDLLLLGQLEGRAPTMRIQPTALALLARRAAEELRGSYPGQHIELAGAEDSNVLADQGRALQILVNLMDNAAKYSPDGSPVAVSWQRHGDQMVVRVRDRGPGVPEDGRDLLFARFGRLAGSRMRAGRVGTGLGLYLGRLLAQAMGGELELEETGPAGSTFLLRLPAALDPPAG